MVPQVVAFERGRVGKGERREGGGGKQHVPVPQPRHPEKIWMLISPLAEAQLLSPGLKCPGKHQTLHSLLKYWGHSQMPALPVQT